MLSRGVVHIYQASFEKNNFLIEENLALLSEDERERAERFHFELDRFHFVFRRVLLRKLLSQYTGQEVSDLRFQYGEHGKPSLAGLKKGKACHFNCSHSKDKVLLAFSASGPLGVDCEYTKREVDFVGITKRFFSNAEIAAFLSLPEHHRRDAFYNCWTRKEAFLKAKGMGLSIGLNQFDVSLRPGEPAKLLRTRYNEKDAREWSLYDLKVFPDFKAALATNTDRIRLIYFDAIP